MDKYKTIEILQKRIDKVKEILEWQLDSDNESDHESYTFEFFDNMVKILNGEKDED